MDRSDAAAVCETLVAYGSDIDATDADGETPLMGAVLQEAIDVVRFLLALNADTTKTNKRGWDVSNADDAEIRQLLSEHSKKTVSLVVLLPADVTVSILVRLRNVSRLAQKHWLEFDLNSVFA